MYGLASYRLAALEGRVPVLGAALTAFLGSIAVLPPSIQVVLFFGLPVALYWFVRTTVNHARSLEDVLRRIEEIECSINELTCEPLMTFQSSHPSRGRAIGGRVGTGTVHSTLTAAAMLLVACNYLLEVERTVHIGIAVGYALFTILVFILCVTEVVGLARYRYRKSSAIEHGCQQ